MPASPRIALLVPCAPAAGRGEGPVVRRHPVERASRAIDVVLEPDAR